MSNTRQQQRSNLRRFRVGGPIMALALIGTSGQIAFADAAGATPTRATAGQVVLFVDSAAAAANTTCTNALPCKTLAAGLAAATAAGNAGADVVILMAAGTYAERNSFTAASLNSLSIAGNGSGNVILDGQAAGTVLTTTGGNVTLAGLTITNGKGTGQAAGGLSVINTATPSGQTQIINSTLSNNTGQFVGGLGISAAKVALIQSTMSGNTATSNVPNAAGNVVVVNGGGNAGGIAIIGSTLAGGGTAKLGGIQTAGLVAFEASVLSSAPCGIANQGQLQDFGYNVESDATCLPTLAQGGNSLTNSASINLASALAANNSTGPQTLALGLGSSALGRVPNEVCTPDLPDGLGGIDERGMPRPGINGTTDCDAGAFELQTPGAPTAVTATPGNASAVVTWTPPAAGGDTPITSYTVTATKTTNPGAPITCTANTITPPATTPNPTCTVTGLTNGDTYSFTVTATDSVGTGPASAPAATATPATAPDVPTTLITTPGGGQVGVAFTAPVNTGGLPVTSYTVTAIDLANPGSPITCTSNIVAPATTPAPNCTVTGLTNGVDYTFTATATNAAATSLPSTAVHAIPTAPPGAPSGVSVQPHNGSADVTVSAPTDDGGAPVGSYVVTATDTTTAANGHQTCTITLPATMCTVPGLTNGDHYTFTATATNTAGTSGPSAPSASVTPLGPPSAPFNISAEPGNGSAIVTVAPPADNGGDPAITYAVTADDATNTGNGGQTCTITAPGTTCTISGLTNGDSYTFSATATNSAGTSAPRGPSAAVTPATVPDAPTNVAAPSGNGTATVTFQAPANDGGADVTGYTVTATDATTPGNGGQTCTATAPATTCTVPGLTNGDSYTFAVTATNPQGTSGPSTPSAAVTPIGPSTAPRNVQAVPSAGSVAVTFDVPANDGGSAIALYTVVATVHGASTHAGGCTTPTATGCTISGLTNGTAYDFTVTAANGVGISPASTPVTATPATAPDAPDAVTATPGNGSAAVTVTPPSDNGGAPVTSYLVTATDTTTPGNGGQTCTVHAPATSCTVPGLTNGDEYTFTAMATNSAGTSGASGPSAAVTPAVPPLTAPGAPGAPVVAPGDESALVSFTAPADSGGDPITAYTVTATDPATGAVVGTCTTTAPATSCTITGLTNGHLYNFTVTATNSTGTGAPSPVTPGTPMPAAGTAQCTTHGHHRHHSGCNTGNGNSGRGNLGSGNSGDNNTGNGNSSDNNIGNGNGHGRSGDGIL